MCNSPRVVQDLGDLAAIYDATVDWQSWESLFTRRAKGEDLHIPRGLERNFLDPQTKVERHIKETIDQYRAGKAKAWEIEIFEQRVRLVRAQESLQRKVTKKAQEAVRISSKKIDQRLRWLQDLRRLEPRESDERIFPFDYAPVLMTQADRRLITPMRFTCRLAGMPSSADRTYAGTYNARRDKLAGFWRRIYGRNHAVMVISQFFENVPRHAYEGRQLVVGEKEENMLLRFTPRPKIHMLVACVWDCWQGPQGEVLHSCAAITQDAPPEIAATGHSRCPIAIRPENLEEWLTPSKVTKDRLEAILDDIERPFYEHQIAAAA